MQTKQQSRLNLKLSQMGLILLGIPATFELIFVITVFALLQQADAEIRMEARSKEIISHAHSLQQHITNAGISIGAYEYSRSELAKETYETALRGLKKELSELSKLLGKNKAQLKRLKELSDTVADTLIRIEDSRKLIESTPVLELLTGNKKLTDDLDQLSTGVGKLQGQIDELVKAERQLSKDLPARRARSRIALLAALSAGAILNILIAVSLALYFQQNFSRRQLVLVENTKRLARSQTLQAPLEGDDEIAQLDRVFHSMVKELAAADQFKKELIAMVSHELRAPLTSVDAILTFLEAGGQGELSEEVKRRLQIAETEVQRLIALINDLLDVERMEAGKFEMSLKKTQLQSVFDRSSQAISGALARADLKLEISKTAEIVIADEDRLVQVVVNLLSNAVKFSPASGTIFLYCQKQGNHLEVSVKDQGKGIGKEFKERIFERFSQVDKEDATIRGGSGLGLTICRAIVEQHHGQIGVESEEGKGARFWFRLLPFPENESAEAPVSAGEHAADRNH